MAGVEILTGVAAVGWYDGMVAALADDAHLEIRAGAVVAATGSYDRVPLVPGNDRPGVMAARTVTGLIERYGVLPGLRPLLVGAGQELATAGERLARAGASVSTGPVPTASLVSIRGRDRVTGAVTRYGRATQRHSADLVVFADRSPNLDLAMAAGAVVGRQGQTLVPIADDSGRTSVNSLFVAGSAAGRPALGPQEAEIARTVGRAAADHAAGRRSSAPTTGSDVGRAPRPSGSTQATHVARGAMVCFCEDVRAWEIRAGTGGRLHRPGAGQAADRGIDRAVPGEVLPAGVRDADRRRR